MSSGTKLWRCTITVDVVVEAESAAEARYTAVRELPDAAETDSACTVTWEVPTPLSLPPGWHDAYPYGGDGEQTCGEILRARLDRVSGRKGGGR